MKQKNRTSAGKSRTTARKQGKGKMGLSSSGKEITQKID